MPFRPGYDPKRYVSKSRNPGTQGAEIVRMDPENLTRYERVKNPSPSASFGSTGSWGGNQGDQWGTFKSVSPAGRDEWTKSSQVSLKADDPW